jgi:hypothetical protein
VKTLHYEDHNGLPCSSQYVIGRLGDKVTVVFVQAPLNETSISSRIEVLAGKVLCSDLRGRHPDEVRFFEHYPVELKRISEWREVVFKGAERMGGLLTNSSVCSFASTGLNRGWSTGRNGARCRRIWRAQCRPC